MSSHFFNVDLIGTFILFHVKRMINKKELFCNRTIKATYQIGEI